MSSWQLALWLSLTFFYLLQQYIIYTYIYTYMYYIHICICICLCWRLSIRSQQLSQADNWLCNYPQMLQVTSCSKILKEKIMSLKLYSNASVSIFFQPTFRFKLKLSSVFASHFLDTLNIYCPKLCLIFYFFFQITFSF